MWEIFINNKQYNKDKCYITHALAKQASIKILKEVLGYCDFPHNMPSVVPYSAGKKVHWTYDIYVCELNRKGWIKSNLIFFTKDLANIAATEYINTVWKTKKVNVSTHTRLIITWG